MRVALLTCNAQARNAIGNQVAEKAGFFLERGAQVRVFLEDRERLHPDLHSLAEQVREVSAHGPVWDYLVDADLVIADYAQFYDLLHYLPLLVGRKPRMVFDYHGVTPAQHWEGTQRALLKRSARQRAIVWCADVALAHSEFAKDELRQATGFPAERIQVAPYPTDAELFHSSHNDCLRERYGPGPILLYVGRLAASKRVPLLIEALARLPEARAVIVGDTDDVYGHEKGRCLELARQLGLAGRVHFVGQVDDRELARIYGGADVLVIPSAHEGYCLPAIEAMASGLPVVAARAGALPETVGDAGLTFAPDDALDLARQVRRVLEPRVESVAGAESSKSRRPVSAGGMARPARVAIVVFRFGGGIVGGAETSLRTMAHALRRGGHHVEVFTTCTTHENTWTNELPAGTGTLDGLTVHRFPIDPHDRELHHDSVRRIVEAGGKVDDAAEAAYLRHSIHTTALLAALRARQAEFDAIITGPYLFGLTHDVACAFPERTLLLPCFHDEPFARMRSLQAVYAAAGGLLYHSPEERNFAERQLGLNHPRSVELGTVIPAACGLALAAPPPNAKPQAAAERYVVYCGRYSEQKNLPLLLEYAERYQCERPGRWRFVFVGQGEVRIPRAAWATDRGRLDEEAKRRVLAHAAAAVQLSRQESLSLVVLEAWAHGTPALVHEDCAVLRGQLARSGGGRAIRDYDGFAQALDDLWERPDDWRALGENGRRYVADRYGCEDAYRKRLLDAIGSLTTPLRVCMVERGLARAAERSRPRWRERFGRFIEQVLDAEPPQARWDVEIEPQAARCRAGARSRTALVPVRVVNRGTLPALADGPMTTELLAEVVDAATGKPIGAASRTALPAALAPGRTQPATLAVTLPIHAGHYQIMLRADSPLAGERTRQHTLPLVIGADETAGAGGASAWLDAIQAALAEAHRLQRLPDDYLDVSEGRFARWKRWLKQKLLGNFKRAYVDVLSRQQSEVNRNVLMSVQQLAEYCATLEHALQTLQQRLDAAPAEAAPAEAAPAATPARNDAVEPVPKEAP
ncbi:MAG: glycosyltransferase [Gemmataceae bacterium]|nr:glycosyltransferase [Gemmataceae bacterium]